VFSISLPAIFISLVFPLAKLGNLGNDVAMKETRILEKQIAALKVGDSFAVETEVERQRASKAGKVLRLAGVVTFVVKTFERDGKFIISAE